MNELQERPAEDRAQEVLARMEEAAALQAKSVRRQSTMLTLAAVACIGIFVLVLIIFLRVNPVLDQLQTAAEDLTHVTNQLAAVDFEATMENLNGAVSATENAVSSLDMESLNNAIADLSRIVAPLAKLFGK